MRAGYVGIDVAIAKDKRLPVVVATFDGECLVPLPLRHAPIRPPRGSGNASTVDERANSAFAREVASYIAAVCDHFDVEPLRIGIDAPSAPRDARLPRRAAEAAMDRLGISCFTTPTEEEFASIRLKVQRHLDAGGQLSRLPHANQLWMLPGFALYQTLESLAPCLEVYPQAAAQVLGVANRHKLQPGAVDEQLRAAARYTGWPGQSQQATALTEIGFGPRHDLLDAYLSCWVAALDEKEREPFGALPSDVIWAPRLQRTTHPSHRKSAHKPQATARQPAEEPSHPRARLCPACENKQFKQWPLGWDAHAAFKCSALTARTPEERKAEFRQRFGDSFTNRLKKGSQ